MERRILPSLVLLALTTLVQLNVATNPVKVAVFYETLCPDSRRFVVDQLYPVYEELKDIMLVDVNAYGKSVDYPVENSFIFICQHGPSECQGNMMMACAKNLIQTEEQFMAFTNCIMTEFSAVSAGPYCAEKNSIDFTPIKECYSSPEGHVLLHEVGEKQRVTAPDLNYVPWILINDVYTDEQQTAAESDLKTVVCSTYDGEKPMACNSIA